MMSDVLTIVIGLIVALLSGGALGAALTRNKHRNDPVDIEPRPEPQKHEVAKEEKDAIREKIKDESDAAVLDHFLRNRERLRERGDLP